MWVPAHPDILGNVDKLAKQAVKGQNALCMSVLNLIQCSVEDKKSSILIVNKPGVTRRRGRNRKKGGNNDLMKNNVHPLNFTLTTPHGRCSFSRQPAY